MNDSYIYRLAARTCFVVIASLAALAVQPTLSQADYPGRSDESTGTAFGPLALNTTYAASLQTENDSDYYYLYASAANQQIHVRFSNTNAVTGPIWLPGTPVALWLENESGESLDAEQYVYPQQTGELAFSVPASGKYYLKVDFSDVVGYEPEPPVGYSFSISSPQPLLTGPPDSSPPSVTTTPAAPPSSRCPDHAATLPHGITVEAECFHKSPGGLLKASGSVHVNGLELALDDPSGLTLDPRTLTLSASGDVDVNAGSVHVYHGRLHWNFDHVLPLPVPTGLTIKGLPVSGTVQVALIPGGAEARLNATVGAASLVASGDVDLKLRTASGLELSSLKLDLATDLPIAGTLFLRRATLYYEHTGEGEVWRGRVAGQLLEDGPALEGELAVLNGAISHIAVHLDELNEPLGQEFVYLQKLGLQVAFDPGVAIAGEIGVSGGPKIDGVAAADLEGSLTAEPGARGVLSARGALALVNQPLADGQVKLTMPPEASLWLDGKIAVSFLFMSAEANIAGDVAPAVSLQGKGNISVPLGSGHGELLANEAGIAGCGSVTVGIEGIEQETFEGVGWRRWDGASGAFEGACGFGRLEYELGAHSASRSTMGVPLRVPPNTRQVNVVVRGSTGPPEVRLEQGNAEALVKPNSTGRLGRSGYLALSDRTLNETAIAIERPTAGVIQVASGPGEPALASVASSLPLPKPDVRVRLRPLRARSYLLHWSADAIPGQVLVFENSDGKSMKRIASTSRAHGQLRFTALDDGTRRPQTLQVVVEQEGLTRETVDGAAFQPSALRLGAPRVGVHRHGDRSLITWTVVPGAKRYYVSVSTSDGRRLFFVCSAGERSLSVAGAAKVLASVRGVGAGMELGRPGHGSTT